MDNLRQSIERIQPELVETRHYLHSHPELSEQEAQTAAFVAMRLQELGLEPRTGVGGHGIVADIEGGSPGGTFALRGTITAHEWYAIAAGFGFPQPAQVPCAR